MVYVAHSVNYVISVNVRNVQKWMDWLRSSFLLMAGVYMRYCMNWSWCDIGFSILIYSV